MDNCRVYMVHWNSFVSTSWSDYAIRDIEKLKQVLTLYPPKWMKHRIIWNLYQKCVRSDMRALQRIWYKLCFFGSRIKNNQPTNIFVMDDSCCCLKDWKFLLWMRRKKHIKLVLTCWNMVKEKRSPRLNLISLEAARKCFDLIITNEPGDAEKYNLSFFPGPFFPSRVRVKNKREIRSDLCFWGQDKNRLDLIKRIKEIAALNNVNCDFKVLAEKSRQERVTGIQYMDRWQPYQDILDQDLSSNCILEIMQLGQEGTTLRTKEAIALNKKLLSNNKALYKSKYYDPRYIQIFDTPEEIDFEWVKECSSVEYHYQGEWSLKILLQKILRELNEKIVEEE